MELSDLRRDFGRAKLDESRLPENPVTLLKDWLQEAQRAAVPDFNAMVLSTVAASGQPSSRVVLLKEITASGKLAFYTSYRSRKGQELEANPRAALLFFWPQLERQIRVEGEVDRLEAKQSDAYFDSRPLESRISAVISPQSRPVASLEELENERKRLLAQSQNIRRPSWWGGYGLSPAYFEFWQGGVHRMHDRFGYTLHGTGWIRERLAP